MALVPLPENPPGLLGRYAARFSRKQFDGLVSTRSKPRHTTPAS